MLTIIYEDDVLLVCNKPAGLMVEPDRNNHSNLLQLVKNYLKEKTGDKQPYAQHLHRLDRVTSGIVLFTKQKAYLRHLSEQFAQRKVSKIYVALTHNTPVNLIGTLNNWHRKEKKKAMIVEEGTPYAENIILDYEVLPSNSNHLWKITLHTGKYHQIRIQLATINCPILGDQLYGSSHTFHENQIALHAQQLIIEHPVLNKKMIFEASPSF